MQFKLSEHQSLRGADRGKSTHFSAATQERLRGASGNTGKGKRGKTVLRDSTSISLFHHSNAKSICAMVSFLDLPGEIRLIIYAYLLHPNDYLSGYRQIETMITAHTDRSRGPSCADPRYYVERYTPSILLVNKQITGEALDVLHRIPLNLEGTPGTYLAMRQMDITEFISEELLQNIHYAILRLDSAHKHFVLPLLDIWGQRNNLKRLDVYRPKATPIPRDHWRVVKSRIRSFSTTVPVVWHKVDDPLKAGV